MSGTGGSRCVVAVGYQLEGVRDALEAVQRVGDDAPGPHHVVGVGRRRRAGWCPRPRWCGSWRACGVTSWDSRSSTIAASNRSSRSATGSSFDGDAGDGDRAGDDDDLVGVVRLVVGLPQRVRAPPATHVGVDDGHEVHRLARTAADLGEEGHVGGVQEAGGGLGVRRDQLVDRGDGVRASSRADARSDRRSAGCTRATARSSISSKRVRKVMSSQPWRGLLVEQRVTPRARQLEEAAQPLLVGHLGDVAEVGLAGGGHRRDQLVLAGEGGLGVAGDLVEQGAAARGGVVDLVDVGAELAATGGDVAVAATGADPAAVDVAGDAGRLDEQVLDRRRRWWPPWSPSRRCR